MTTTTETEIASTQELARKRRDLERKAQDLREDRAATEEKIGSPAISVQDLVVLKCPKHNGTIMFYAVKANGYSPEPCAGSTSRSSLTEIGVRPISG